MHLRFDVASTAQLCHRILTSAKAVQIRREGLNCQCCDWPHARHGLGPPCRFSFFGSTLHPLIQRCNLNIETFDLGEFSDVLGLAYGLNRNCVGQAFDVVGSLCCNNAVLGKMAMRHANGVLIARRVDRLGALSDEHLSCPKHYGMRLLGLGLQRKKPPSRRCKHHQSGNTLLAATPSQQ